MVGIAEFRSTYPEYNDLSDEDLISRAARRGIAIEPQRVSLVGNVGLGAQQALRGIGGDAYRVLEEVAAQIGWDGARDWATEELRNRDAELRERQQRMRPGRMEDFWENPAGVTTGAIGQAAGSIPLALHPAGWALMFGGHMGENIEEQRNAQGLQPGEANLLSAGATAAGQTALERAFGLEGWAARGLPGGAGNRFQRGLHGMGAGAIGEAWTEGAQRALSIAQGDLSDPGRVFEANNMYDIAENAFLGGLGGGAMRGSISALGRGDHAAPQPTPDMTLDQALDVAYRAGPPAAPAGAAPDATVSMFNAPIHRGVESEEMIMAGMVSPDPVEREIAMAAIPIADRINALQTYQRARASGEMNQGIRDMKLREGVERPPGQWGEARTAMPPITPANDTAPVAALAPPAARESARSPLDDMVSGMQPDATPRRDPNAAPDPVVPTAATAPAEAASAPASAAPSPTAPAPDAAQPSPAPAATPSAAQADPNLPDQETLTRANAVIEAEIGKIAKRGKQAETTAAALRSAIDDGLRTRRFNPAQAAAAFTMADAMSNILPVNAGQQVEFAGRMMAENPDGRAYEQQGTQKRERRATPEGMQGLIRLSLSEAQLPLARETAAHEAWHVIEDWFRATDPKVWRELQRAFPQRDDGHAYLADVDPSLQRLLKRHKHSSGVDYLTYLSRAENGFGPGVFRDSGEAMANVFGAIYDLRASGAPVQMKPLLKRAFDFFVNLMDRIRSSPSRALMEAVASGDFRRATTEKTADITTEGLSHATTEGGVAPEPQRGPDPERRVPEVDRSQRASSRGLPDGRGVAGSQAPVPVQAGPNAEVERDRVREVGRTKAGDPVYSARDEASEREEPLKGQPTQIRIKPVPKEYGLPGSDAKGAVYQVGPLARARRAAENYTAKAGIPYYPSKTYAKADPERGRRIAAAFDAMQSDPTNPLVREAYDAMAEETMAQWEAMKETGLQVEFFPDPGQDPYMDTPWNVHLDVARNNHMYVYPTDWGYGVDENGQPQSPSPEEIDANPMLRDTGERWNGQVVRLNDLFRAVHDYFGHIKDGVGFRADGEENAWRSHAAMYSPLARMAMTTETRGQNSWLNFGPHAEANVDAKVADTVFAEQKLGLLPAWVMREGAEDFLQPLPFGLERRLHGETTRESSRRVHDGPFRLVTEEEFRAAGMQRQDVWDKKQDGFGRYRAMMIADQTAEAARVPWQIAGKRFGEFMDRNEFFTIRDGLDVIRPIVPKGYAPLINALSRAVNPGTLTYTSHHKGNAQVRGVPLKITRNIGPHHQPVNDTGGFIYMDLPYLSKGNYNPALVFMHEVVHAAAYTATRSIEKRAAMGHQDAIDQLRVLDKIRDISAEHAFANDLWLHRLNAGQFSYMHRGNAAMINSTMDRDPSSGRDEFLAEALISPYFQSFLSTVPLTEDLQQEIEALTGGKPRNMLQAMVDWLRSILDLNANTALDGVFILSPHFLNMGHLIPAEPQPAVEAERESARALPQKAKDAIDKLAPEQPAGWFARALGRQPWKAGMRAELASRFRSWAVDQYSAVEDLERIHTGKGRLTADMSGYTALWQAEDVDRYRSAIIETGGYLELVQDPKNPGSSYFKVNPNKKGGMAWLTDLLSGTDPTTGKRLTKPDGSPLIETAEEAEAMMRAFQTYAIAKRGTNLNAQGILVPIGAKERAAAAEAAKAFPEIVPAFDRYQEYNRNLMKLAVDSGVISQADANAFMKHNDYYPFYRAVPKNDPIGARRIAGISSKFKAKEILGGTEPFADDPITVILDNTAYWMHASMRNVAKQKVVDTGRKLNIVRAFDPKKDSPDIKISLRVNGVDYAFASDDPHLTSALESYWGLDEDSRRWFYALGWPARFLRELVTKNPAFMLFTNPVRDSVAAWQASGSNFTPVIGTYTGMVQAMRRDKATMNYVELGHGGSRRYEDSAFRDAGDLFRDDILVEKGVYRATGPGQLMGLLRKGYLMVDRVSEASDLATRIAIFEKELAAGHNEAEAAWRAREVMNFTKRGRSNILRIMSMLVPFTNARIQGLDVTYQSLRGGRVGDPGKEKQFNLGRAMARGGLLTLAAVMLTMAFGDDDEVKDQPQWMRNQNVLIPLRAIGLGDQGVLAIPKPFEYGALFMTLPEHLYRYLIAGNQSARGAVREGLGGLMSSLAYNPLPTIGMPFFEQAVNYSLFTGRPIIGRSLQGQSPEWQFTAHTPEFYKQITRALAASGIPSMMSDMGIPLPGFMTSPERMNHFVRSFTGSLGTQAAVAAGVLTGADDFRDFDWRRLPVVSSLIRNQGSPAGINSLYELAEESAQLTQQIRRYSEAGDMAMVRELNRRESGLIAARPLITRTQRQLQRLSQEERAVTRNDRLPSDERRRRLDAIARQRREAVRGIEELRVRLGR